MILLFLAWNRELNRLLDRRMLWGILAFLLVAVPWFGLVAAETRGAYIRAFFGNDNVNRFLSPMENHRGPIFYYVGTILIFFAPWSIVIGPTIWSAMKSSKENNDNRPQRFLLLWVLAYLVFFSFAATKLPNYIAPLYPALALLTASFLHRWASGTLPVARWVMPTAAGGMAVIGIVVIVGLLIVGGAIFTNLKGLRLLPDLAPWAASGYCLSVARSQCWSFLNANSEIGPLRPLLSSQCYLFPPWRRFSCRSSMRQRRRNPSPPSPAQKQLDRDIRLASLDYSQESVTFYTKRRVERLHSATEAAAFLAMPRPGYLFVPAKVWDEQLVSQVGPHRIAAQRYDFYRNADILVVTNDGASP